MKERNLKLRNVTWVFAPEPGSAIEPVYFHMRRIICAVFQIHSTMCFIFVKHVTLLHVSGKCVWQERWRDQRVCHHPQERQEPTEGNAGVEDRSHYEHIHAPEIRHVQARPRALDLCSAFNVLFSPTSASL